MKKKSLIIVILLIVFSCLTRVNANDFTYDFKVTKEGGRLALHATGYLPNDLDWDIMHFYNSSVDGLDNFLYNEVPMYVVATETSAYYGDDQLYVDSSRPESCGGDWTPVRDEVFKLFMKKDIMNISVDSRQKAFTSMWAWVARCYEIAKEVEYRMKSERDIHKLQLYNNLLAFSIGASDVNSSMCLDNENDYDDPLFAMGCVGSPVLYNSEGYREIRTEWMLANTMRTYGYISTEGELQTVFNESKSAEEFAEKIKGNRDHKLFQAIYKILDYMKGLRDKIQVKINEHYYEQFGIVPEWEMEEAEGGWGDKIESDSGSKVDVSDSGKNWWVAARDFFKAGSDSGKAFEDMSLVEELTGMIFDIGNMIFIIVTSILGVRYIYASAEGKANIKDSLMTLIVAALFFYGWQVIDSLLDIGTLFASDSYQTVASKIYNTVLFIIDLAAIGGIIWIGVKYMLSSAEGKAEIKTSWGPLILGIIMVYATVKFLQTVVTIVLG